MSAQYCGHEGQPRACYEMHLQIRNVLNIRIKLFLSLKDVYMDQTMSLPRKERPEI